MLDLSRITSVCRCVRLIVGVSFVLLNTFALTFALQAQQSSPKCPPATPVKSVHDSYGTVDVVDAYRWLEDQNSPETRAWIEEEQ